LVNDASTFAYDAVIFCFVTAIFAYDRAKMNYYGLKMVVLSLRVGDSVIVAGNCLNHDF